jgi:antitoxin HicB
LRGFLERRASEAFAEPGLCGRRDGKIKLDEIAEAQYRRDVQIGNRDLVPSLPGCVSYGRTVKQATAQAREAILLHLKNLKAHRLPVPVEARRPILTTSVQVTLARA